MRPRSQELAEKLLLLTLSLERALQEEEPSSITALLDERNRVLDALQQAPPTSESTQVLVNVMSADKRLLETLQGLRASAMSEISRGRAGRAAAKTYCGPNGRVANLDSSQ